MKRTWCWQSKREPAASSKIPGLVCCWNRGRPTYSTYESVTIRSFSIIETVSWSSLHCHSITKTSQCRQSIQKIVETLGIDYLTFLSSAVSLRRAPQDFVMPWTSTRTKELLRYKQIGLLRTFHPIQSSKEILMQSILREHFAMQRSIWRSH